MEWLIPYKLDEGSDMLGGIRQPDRCSVASHRAGDQSANIKAASFHEQKGQSVKSAGFMFAAMIRRLFAR